jgi:hypothetical protein
VTCEVELGDPTTVARIINLAHRFLCSAVRVESVTDGAVTRARFEFSGEEKQLDRLRAQIDRIIQVETIFVS